MRYTINLPLLVSDLSNDNNNKISKKSLNTNKGLKRKKDSFNECSKESAKKLETNVSHKNEIDCNALNSNIECLPLCLHSPSSADSNASVNGDNNSANESIKSNDKSKKKKARTTFTGRQIFELEKQFEIKKYLSSSERSEMAKLLNVTETQVRNFCC